MSDLPGSLHDIMGSAIYDMVGTELNQSTASLRSAGYGDDRGTGLRGKLDGCKAHAAGCSLNEDGFSRRERAAREKTVLRGSERDRQYRSICRVQSIRDAPCSPLWHGPELRMRALHVKCRDPIPDLAACDVRSHRRNRARRRVAYDPGRMRRRCRATVDQIAPFNRDRFDSNQNVVGPDDWVRSIDVPQDFGGACLVVNRCFHNEFFLSSMRRITSDRTYALFKLPPRAAFLRYDPAGRIQIDRRSSIAGSERRRASGSARPPVSRLLGPACIAADAVAINVAQMLGER